MQTLLLVVWLAPLICDSENAVTNTQLLIHDIPHNRLEEVETNSQWLK
jgi:hypothetical protein